MSHHYSGPDFSFPQGDARLDFTDLYAFPKPGEAGKSILIMNVHPSAGENPPGATPTEPFAPEALYELKIDTDADGFLTVSPKAIAEDFAQDLPDKEKQLLTATQGPTAAAVFGATIATAAWRTKPSWCVIASNDRAVPPELQKAEAAAMKASSITVASSHVPMLSHPKEVADLIEQAAAKAGSGSR